MSIRSRLRAIIDSEQDAKFKQLQFDREQLLARNTDLDRERRQRSEREDRLAMVLRYIAQHYPLHEAGQMARAALVEDDSRSK